MIRGDMYSDVIEEYNKYVERNKPLISVFILTHNRRTYLELAVNSVLKQTHSGFVLWILNNGSADNTEAYLESIVDNRVIYSNTNVHSSFNMRFARDICKTKYFIILHDDDLVEKTYLEEVLTHMEDNGYAELSVGATYIDGDGKDLTVLPKARFDNREYVFQRAEYLENFFESHFKEDCVCESLVYPSVIYRTSFYQSIGEVFLTEPGPAGDQLVHFETERNGGTICYLAKSLIRYRIHGTQDSQQNAGFMDLQLMDYLIHNEYYKAVLDQKKEAIRSKIWLLYRAIVGKACRKQISREKWESFFSYDCIQQLKKDPMGKCLYSKMRMVYHLPHIIGIYYKIVKG